VCCSRSSTAGWAGACTLPSFFSAAAIGWGGLYATMAGELGGKKQAGLASGYLVDATGSYRASWILMAACAGAAVLTVSLVREPRTVRATQCVAVSGGGK
jgi:hypothetical protein